MKEKRRKFDSEPPTKQLGRISSEFARVRPSSEAHATSGEMEAVKPLVLDLSELDEEPITKRYTYIENLAQLRERLRRAIVHSPNWNFDVDDFIKRLVSISMLMQEKNSDDRYYIIEERYGAQYRLYVEPKGMVSGKCIDTKKRVAIDFGDQIAYLFPVVFTKDERRDPE